MRKSTLQVTGRWRDWGQTLVTNTGHKNAGGQKEEKSPFGKGKVRGKHGESCWLLPRKVGENGTGWTKWMSYVWEEKVGGWVCHNQSESEMWITRQVAGAKNERNERRLQMAGPKHIEVQAEAWPTASRISGGMGQCQSPIPAVSKYLWTHGTAPNSVLDHWSTHRRRPGECYWNTSHGPGVPEEALLCRGWAHG